MNALPPSERKIRQRLKDDLPHYAEKCLSIRPKGGGLIPFVLNEVQMLIHEAAERQLRETGQVRLLILKARQPGCSTYVAGRFYWKVTHHKGKRAFILTHRQDATDNLFGMVGRFHEHCPAVVKPATGAASAKELSFSALDSGYRVGTAGAAEIGRSETIQLLHGSEVAFWPKAEDHMGGIMQAVPRAAETEVVLESTANGVGGLFYNMCKAAERGEGAYRLVFIPWFAHADYREEPPENWEPPLGFTEYIELHELSAEQAYWAVETNATLALAIRAPLDEICWKFRQEYPATAEEAFQAGDHDSFIKPESVLRARKWTAPDQSHAPLLLGVDIARGGGDRTRMLDRRGRCLGALINRTINSDDLMEVAGIVARTIDQHDVTRTFIDVTGLGAGVYDRLVENGYRKLIRAVNFGAAAIEDKKYANKRAEMWGELRDWLDDAGGADIPDDDALHSHLCAPGYKHDSNSRILLEKKELIKKRVGFSPDGGDAAGLTFAEPVLPTARRGRRPTRANSGYSPHRWRQHG